MILNARSFEEYFGICGNFPKWFEPIEFNGNLIRLRITDAREFSGVSRLYFDGKRQEVNTGNTVIPLGMRDPFRLREMTAYKVLYHLDLNTNFPDGVFATIIPSSMMVENGLFIYSDRFYLKGLIWTTVVSFKKIELSLFFPIGDIMIQKEEGDILTSSEEFGEKKITKKKKKETEK